MGLCYFNLLLHAKHHIVSQNVSGGARGATYFHNMKICNFHITELSLYSPLCFNRKDGLCDGALAWVGITLVDPGLAIDVPALPTQTL